MGTYYYNTIECMSGCGSIYYRYVVYERTEAGPVRKCETATLAFAIKIVRTLNIVEAK